jgi:signal transduction histidine kinase
VYEWNDSVIGHLDNYDGLVADPTRCGYVDGEGNLWIGTVGGVSRLEMKGFTRKPDAPPIHIEGVALDEQTQPNVRTSFSYDENNLTMYFNSLSFRDERQTEFQWMLAGFDATWQPPRRERHVRYTHLPWGTYEFLVRARNRRTAWSEPVRLAFVIHPPFWGTWWFRVLSATSVVGGLFLFYRRRVRVLEKEKFIQQEFSLRLMESQENERKRIAGELHDGLGQNLLVIRNRALLGLKDAKLSKQARDQLDQISSVATQAIDEVREISYDLRPYQLDRLGLTKAIRSITSRLASSVQFSMDVDSIDDEVGKDQAIHVYRIVQEGINNILKHAGASEASVLIRVEKDNLRITISDNGKGVLQASSDEPDGRQGFGLVGISERAKVMNGTMTMESTPNGGTTLTVLIPRPRKTA